MLIDVPNWRIVASKAGRLTIGQPSIYFEFGVEFGNNVLSDPNSRKRTNSGKKERETAQTFFLRQFWPEISVLAKGSGMSSGM